MHTNAFKTKYVFIIIYYRFKIHVFYYIECKKMCLNIGSAVLSKHCHLAALV